MKIFSTSLIAACLLLAVSVSHASEGIYLGFNLGQASYDVTLNDFAELNDGTLTSPSFDDTDSSYRLTIGYQLLPYFSLEGGYIDFGNFSATATSDGTGIYPPGIFSTITSADGFFIDVKGQIPLNEQFSLYGTYGLLSWKSETVLSASTGILERNKYDDNDSFFGVGGSFNIYDTLALNVDYTFYKLDELDVDVFSVGIQFGY